MKLAVCVRTKNCPILIDWIFHYINLGFDKIIIYDNHSNPSVKERINSFGNNIISDIVEIEIFDKLGDAFTPALKKYGDDYDWMLLCDDDEFLYTKEDLKTFLSKIDEDVGTILINWICYGNNNIEKYNPELSVYEQFIYREDYQFFFSRFVKSFVRSKYIKSSLNCHYTFDNQLITLDGNLNYVNTEFISKEKADLPNYILNDDTPLTLVHYMTLGINNMLKKAERNKAFSPFGNKYSLEWYKCYNFKDNILDTRMFKYLDNYKKFMLKTNNE